MAPIFQEPPSSGDGGDVRRRRGCPGARRARRQQVCAGAGLQELCGRAVPAPRHRRCGRRRPQRAAARTRQRDHGGRAADARRGGAGSGVTARARAPCCGDIFVARGRPVPARRLVPWLPMGAPESLRRALFRRRVFARRGASGWCFASGPRDRTRWVSVRPAVCAGGMPWGWRLQQDSPSSAWSQLPCLGTRTSPWRLR